MEINSQLGHSMQSLQFVLIVLFSVLCAILYGLALDQITIRISLEYFTVGHPPLFTDRSPTALALKWGVTASWWVGTAVGFILAMCSRMGRRPRVSLSELINPIVLLLGIVAISAILMGGIGYMLAYFNLVNVPAGLASRIPTEHQVAFVCAEFMHDASYAVGLVGCYGLIEKVLKFRFGKITGIKFSWAARR